VHEDSELEKTVGKVRYCNMGYFCLKSSFVRWKQVAWKDCSLNAISWRRLSGHESNQNWEKSKI